MLFLVERLDDPRPINLGTGLDVSIRELAELIAAESGYRGAVAWDPSKPDGMPRKCLDCGRLRDLGFRAAIDLETGVRRTIAEYRALRAGHLSLPGSAAA
jgi:GDP-L-fucose synthase